MERKAPPCSLHERKRGNKEENLSSNKRGTRSEGAGASLIALSNDFPHIPSMFANAKTFNALPQHEKPREKTIRGFNKKGKSLEGGGREPLKRFPSPLPRFSLRYAPRAASARLRARAS